MRISALVMTLCSSAAVAATTEIFQSLNSSQAIDSVKPVLESLLDIGNCNIPGCLEELIPIANQCSTVITSDSPNIDATLTCLKVIISNVSDQSDYCVVCIREAISSIESEL
ncbi:uncharacterized protein APUU_61002S [Aspergillus puulaauensis]|uniref:Fungal calcium binding protein domain-containing protein n=1 Tax=Aspergillus puulaauensis TaxID=1220207 RepID=A0A7R8AQ85_9EURO|nr:uncharacterized protein APUU_61002S [Aspergillus puulaauensis]BCS27954.1 hypothetical protein APUU_61002S [Aspergillus puulaauensis]